MAIGIGIGISRFPFEDARGYWRWVEQCEMGKVNSIWQTDRLVSKEPILECFSAMAAIAGATEKIRFGMNVASIALRDPVLVAKQCATIDMLSNGRLLPAFGLGSSKSKDFVARGVSTKGRGKKANEALALIQRLWQEDDVKFSGEFFQYSGVSIAPKPANAKIPLWIGGSSEVAMRRTAQYGTGWLGGLDSPKQAGIMIQGIKRALQDTGRSIDDDHYGATFSFRFGKPAELADQEKSEGLNARLKKDPQNLIVVGDGAAIVQRINEYIDNGCSKLVMLPIATGEKQMLEQTRLFINEVLPAFE
ncbi:MAG: LLM class flavin-dependent oxidoreductase [Pseudomonadales bacterium]|nr:LLM class flavin-dependent oxidoreductase [Pseudomonadales bacterium]